MLACLLFAASFCTPPQEEYLVTIPQVVRVFRVCGKDRLDALMNLHPTVWTKSESIAARLAWKDSGYPGQILCAINADEIRWVYPNPFTGDCPR